MSRASLSFGMAGPGAKGGRAEIAWIGLPHAGRYRGGTRRNVRDGAASTLRHPRQGVLPPKVR